MEKDPKTYRPKVAVAALAMDAEAPGPYGTTRNTVPQPERYRQLALPPDKVVP
jgi:hypothetical protein